MKCKWLLTMAAGLAAVSVAGAEPREEHTYTVDTSNPMLTVIPELRKAPAPKWVKPGMRLTWHQMSASIPMAYQAGLRQDPDGKWVDPSTGQHFTMEDSASASGAGYCQLEILAVHDDGVVVDSASYGVEGVNGPVRTSSGSGFVSPPGVCGDFWINPAILGKQADVKLDGVQISHVPFRAANKDYKALWISSNSAGASSSTVTDLETGVILREGTSGATAGTTALINNIPTNLGGQTYLSQTNFLGMREVKAPWAGGALPDCLHGIKRLTYVGTHAISVPGIPVVPWKATVVFEITGRGSDFIQGKRHARIDAGFGIPQTSDSDFVSGCTELMPTAVPPVSMRQLHQGQVLDEDPITKIVTSVAFIGRDQNGNNVAVISTSAGPNTLRNSAAYDLESGLLVGLSTVDPIMNSDTELALVQKE